MSLAISKKRFSELINLHQKSFDTDKKYTFL
jgi:hypothetical protein